MDYKFNIKNIYNILPPIAQQSLKIFSIFLLLFTLLRSSFFIIFFDEMSKLPIQNIIQSFFIGFRFDIRLAVVIILPFIILFPIINPNKLAYKKFWTLYWVISLFFLLILYVTDIGYYSYLNSRLDASIMGLLKDFLISISMVQESYPIYLILTILCLLMFIFYRLMIKINYNLSSNSRNLTNSIGAYLCILAFFLSLGYGKISRYPFRWSDAFYSTNHSANQLSINPVLYFFNTISRVSETYNIDRVKEFYPTISNLLNVDNPNVEKLNFSRKFYPKKPNSKKTNIVIIFLETFPSFKCGILGNPLNPTPYFDKLAKKSILFSNFFVPKMSTAASIYSTLSGIPDMAIINKSSTRDPFAIKQDMIINQLIDYNKFFFIGGSANWGDLNGFLKNNIHDISIYEEGSFDTPEINAWGISDFHLLQEANQVFSLENEPFIAMILTAGHHRPYTIPNDIKGFDRSGFTKKHTQYSFGEDEFYAFKFMDFSLGQFFNSAKKENYFHNTLFVIYGDHGSFGNHLEKTHGDLTQHQYNVPLLLYGPGLNIMPSINEKVISEIDIFPTILSLLDIPYENRSIGRNIFSDNQSLAFLFSASSQRYALLSDSSYIIYTDENNYKLFRYPYFSFNEELKIFKPEDKLLINIGRGIYETSRYLRYTNSRSKRAK